MLERWNEAIDKKNNAKRNNTAALRNKRYELVVRKTNKKGDHYNSNDTYSSFIYSQKFQSIPPQQGENYTTNIMWSVKQFPSPPVIYFQIIHWKCFWYVQSI